MKNPDRFEFAAGEIELNARRERRQVTVSNTGDRAIQVGSHYHFFEANRALRFDRAAAFGMHLDVPAGTAVRFEPGDTHEVALCSYGGTGLVRGFNGLVQGGVRSESTHRRALRRLRERDFLDSGEGSAPANVAGTRSAAKPKGVTKPKGATKAKRAAKSKGSAKTKSAGRAKGSARAKGRKR